MLRPDEKTTAPLTLVGLLPLLSGAAAFAVATAFFFSHAAPWTLRGDNLLFPLTVNAFRSWISGRPPEWSTGLWGGFPLLADPSSAALYWPFLVFFPLTPSPHLRAYDLATAFHAGVLTAGSVRLLLLLGTAPIAALLGGVLIFLAPLQVWSAAGILVYYCPLAWLPCLLVAAEEASRSVSRRASCYLLFGQLVLATQALLFPELALYSGVVAVVWLITRAGPVPVRTRVVRAALLAAGGLALSAPQVLTTLAYLGETSRGGALGPQLGDYAALDWSSLRALADVWGAQSRRFPTFIGPAALLLSVCALASRRPRARFLWFTAALTLGLGLGLHSPLYPMLHGLPPFNRFRIPLKFFAISELVFAWLAALGADELLRPGRSRRIVVLASLLGLFAIGERLAYMAIRFANPEGLPAAGDVSFPVLHTDMLSSGLLEFAVGGEGSVPPRIDETVGLGSLPMLYGIESLTGRGVALLPRRHSALLAPPNAFSPNPPPPSQGALDLYGVDLLLVSRRQCRELAAQNRLGLLHTTERTCLFRNPSAPPRYALLDRARPVASVDEMIDVVRDDPAGPVPVLAPALVISGHLPAGPPGQVRVIAYRAGDVRLEVDAERSALLFARESWNSGWRVDVDGEPAPVFPAGGLFFAAPVPSGRHRVGLHYRAPGFRAGVLVAALWAAACGWGVRKSRAPR